MRRRVRMRWAGVAMCVAVLSGCARTIEVSAPRLRAADAGRSAVQSPRPDPDRIQCEPGSQSILVLYDEPRAGFPDAGLLVAQQTSNLVSPFGIITAVPVTEYAPGQVESFDALVYVSTSAEDRLPPALLADIMATERPVVWAGGRVDILAATPAVQDLLGWRVTGVSPWAADVVRYRGGALAREPDQNTSFIRFEIIDPQRASILGVAEGGGETSPWAVRSRNLTVVAEEPYSFATNGSRYLAWADLLIEVLAPDTSERHRALVRIEDVGPATDPEAIRQITRVLGKHKVPFSLAVYPSFRDPAGVLGSVGPAAADLTDRPELVAALHEAVDAGATIVMHGVTHQYGSVPNPYGGTSGADYEFYRAHVNHADDVVLDGPVETDSAEWVAARLQAGLEEFARAGFARPSIFEFPHYAGSVTSYEIVSEMFPARYERSLYFVGDLAEEQYFPFKVKDAYGSCIVPENLGFISPEALNNNAPRFAEDIIRDAERMLVVRDSIASFFYHPHLDASELERIVESLMDLGYTFVDPETVLAT